MKHLVDIDPKLLEDARKAMGTKTIKATVEVALKQVADRALFERHLERLRKHAPEMRRRFDRLRGG